VGGGLSVARWLRRLSNHDCVCLDDVGGEEGLRTKVLLDTTIVKVRAVAGQRHGERAHRGLQFVELLGRQDPGARRRGSRLLDGSLGMDDDRCDLGIRAVLLAAPVDRPGELVDVLLPDSGAGRS
jgi:hypothetical protein